MLRHKYTHTERTDRYLPFHCNTDHEANAGHQAKDVNEVSDVVDPTSCDFCHPDDHTKELNEVRDKEVDDVDRSDVIVSHLQENIIWEKLQEKSFITQC